MNIQLTLLNSNVKPALHTGLSDDHLHSLQRGPAKRFACPSSSCCFSFPFSCLTHLSLEFTDSSALTACLALYPFTQCTVLLPFLSSVFGYFTRLPTHSMANMSRLDTAPPRSYDDLPAAAQRVPRSTLLHTILFKRISFPLTSRRDELWVIEVDQSGHETWSSLEEFFCRFCPPVDLHVLP